ncbi:MAG: c-type cytochrome, partial [Alphaproteobacteria bacterium]
QPEQSHNAPSLAGLIVFLALLAVIMVPPAAAAEDDEWTNPFLGDPQAIEEGGRLFRGRCIGCHWSPLRGPRIFQTKRSYEKFLDIVINGKKSLRTMPPFGTLLSPDDISKIHAFLMSREGL